MLQAARLELQEPQHEPSQSIIAAALLTQVVLLAVALVAGRCLDHWNVTWLGDAGSALILGMLGGLLSNLPSLDKSYSGLIEFKSGIFFYFLLPPIMFDAGYSMDISRFLKNISSILAYALIGTTISMFLIGTHMWVAGLLGLCYPLTLLQGLLFGSIVSATDPVAVLAVFRKLHVNEELYINVFGESALNDAVGMVLFQTVSHYLHPGTSVNAWSILEGAGMFMLIFVGSTVVGLVVGACASLLFKTRFLTEEHTTLETCLVIMFAFSSYLVATSANLSGIISCMFCGMMMSKYTRPNLSVTARMQVSACSEVMAACCELFVFVYMGTIIFRLPWSRHVVAFTAVSLVALAHSRAANIFPITAVINLLRRSHPKISLRQQFVMWWSGLRGGMAFALSLEAAAMLGEVGNIMLTATFLQSLVTVLLNGGLVGILVQKFKLKADDAQVVFDRLPSCDLAVDSVDEAATVGDPALLIPDPGSPSNFGALETLSPRYTIRRSRSKRLRRTRTIHDVFMDLDRRTLSRFFIATEAGSSAVLHCQDSAQDSSNPLMQHAQSEPLPKPNS